MSRMAMVVMVALLSLIADGTAAGRDGKTSPALQGLDLAASLLLDGKPDEARGILESLPVEMQQVPQEPRHGYSPERERAERQALQWGLAHATLEPGDRDPFELLTTILSNSDWGGGAGDPIADVAWQRLFARYATREGYPAISEYLLGRSLSRLNYILDPKYAAHREAAEVAKAAVDRDVIVRESALLAAAGAPAAVSQRPGGPGGAADRVGPTLTRLLATARLVPFPESALPPGIKRYRPPKDATGEEADDADGAVHFAGLTLPAGFAPVRAERRGDEAAAIGVSQDYDPVGEVSPGAYWVIRSHDAGGTWGAPLYTGLRISAPYVIHPASNLALLVGDHLEIEVSIRELDEESITFPPIGLRAKREKDGLMLTMRFEDLERDSDHDGLTDLAEERLLTDPNDPDTDGDGLGDRNDPLPQVPWSGMMGDTAGALSTVLEQIAGMKSMAIIHGIEAPEASVESLMARAQRATLTDDRTIFILGRRSDFRPLLTSRRAVVLTADELAAARKKFGLFFPIELSLFVIDHAGQNGYVIWDADWVGGVLALEKQDGTWVIRTVSSWIT